MRGGTGYGLLLHLQLQRSQDDKKSARDGDESPRHYSRWEILVGDQPKEGGEGVVDEYDVKRTIQDTLYYQSSVDDSNVGWDELLLTEVGDQSKGQMGGGKEGNIYGMEDDLLSGSDEEYMKGLNIDLLSGGNQSSRDRDSPDTNLSGRQGGSPAKETPMSGMIPVTINYEGDLMTNSGSPTTIQAGLIRSNVLRRGKQFVDAPGDGHEGGD